MARRWKEPVRKGPTLAGLAAWFGLGLVVSVPAAFAVRAFASPAPRTARKAPSVSPEERARREMEVTSRCRRAHELFQAERLAEAHEEYSRASRVDPEDPRPFLGIAEVCQRLNYDETAEDALRRALELDPENRDAKLSLAKLLYDFGKHREALRLAQELDRASPGDPLVGAEIAINALRLGDPKEAVRRLEAYNAREGRQAWGWENLGRAHAEAGNAAEAERCFREAIAIDPRTSMAHLWLGQLLVSLGRQAEAEAPLRTYRELRILQTQAVVLAQAVNRAPDDVPSLVRLAQVRAALGQFREALVPLERALRLAPDDERIRELHASVESRVPAPR